MKSWLSQHFIRVGIIALTVDVMSRLYSQLIIQWLIEEVRYAGWTINQSLRLSHVSIALDIAATLMWGLFSLGFAWRVLAYLDTLQAALAGGESEQRK